METENIVSLTEKRDKHIWVFNGGNDFSGNPKWLFMYIVNYRKDITPYWLCYHKANEKYIRKLGYKACLFNSSKGRKVMQKAGVYVVNQMKEVFQPELEGVTVLNLWHGVGCKSIERKVSLDFLILKPNMAKKYIVNNHIYRNNQLFLVTSPLMEKHFKEQCGIEEDKLIRGGYPCCMYGKYKGEVRTFNHDILGRKGLLPDTKIALYAPTYRDSSANDFIESAVPDMNRLIETLKANNILLIFKMHPFMSNDYHYRQLKGLYENHPNLMFWNNEEDIYEIFDKIDIGIIDYSSMFYDMLAGGIKHFIRYMFDIDASENVRDFVFDVREMTCGRECFDFEQLLAALSNADSEPDEEADERARIYDLFWQYENEASFEEIITKAENFIPDTRKLPDLYSFDIFDTLIKRKGMLPVSIFYEVQEKLNRSHLDFPDYLKCNFVQARKDAEANAREYYRKLQDIGMVRRLEIAFDEIYERLGKIYGLTKSQIDFLQETEIEAEIENCIPYEENIEILKGLLERGEKVILLSDMYLPKEVIHKMLIKADPVLGRIPLYLSSDSGFQKTTKRLYLYAFKDLAYDFGAWIHYGDNAQADKVKPQQLGIKTVNHRITAFNNYEEALTKTIGSYDAYLTAAMMARFREQKAHTEAEIYAYEYAALYFVPYIGWVVRNAVSRGLKCLYFISRDGYHLKRIADAIIEAKRYDLKTKYIYGSRKAWRIPSFIESIDEEFFTGFGQFVGCHTFPLLLKAMGIDEKTFDDLFPELSYIKTQKRISKKTLAQLRKTFKNSAEYCNIIMERAERERPIVLDYLRQEIDFDESYAFVEYWGRGYTQDCLTRLLCEASGRELEDPCYYVRCIYPTEGLSVRYNFTTTRSSLIFVEALFANLPYRSVIEYKREGGHIAPVLNSCENDKVLHEAFEQYLVQFAKDFYSMKFLDEVTAEKELFNFSLSYYQTNMEDKYIVENLGHLKDSVELYGKVREFAPPVTLGAIFRRLRGEWFDTKSVRISIARSKKIYGRIYLLYHNKLRHKRTVKKLISWRKKLKKLLNR